jgi:enterochelin esterase-like enzyme
VAVYVPAQYVPGTPAPFIVAQDGYSPKYHLTLPTALDKLIAVLSYSGTFVAGSPAVARAGRSDSVTVAPTVRRRTVNLEP